jgi:hypothetical protein
MTVASGCIIENLTDKEQSLAGSVIYDALLLDPNGGTIRKSHVNFASNATSVTAHGRIEGGLSIYSDCPANGVAAECLKKWLGKARELILVGSIGVPKAHVTMDRDSDPLGILK